MFEINEDVVSFVINLVVLPIIAILQAVMLYVNIKHVNAKPFEQAVVFKSKIENNFIVSSIFVSLFSILLYYIFIYSVAITFLIVLSINLIWFVLFSLMSNQILKQRYSKLENPKMSFQEYMEVYYYNERSCDVEC